MTPMEWFLEVISPKDLYSEDFTIEEVIRIQEFILECHQNNRHFVLYEVMSKLPPRGSVMISITFFRMTYLFKNRIKNWDILKAKAFSYCVAQENRLAAERIFMNLVKEMN